LRHQRIFGAYGRITAIAGGTATIKVTTHDGGFSASCSVTVTVPVTGVSLNKTSLDISAGNTDSIAAIISPEDATNKVVSWSSSNTAVATVDDTGNITAISSGIAVITVTTHDGAFTAICSVTVPITWTASYDSTVASTWFESAAYHKHVHSEYYLGKLSYTGEGVTQSYTEAAEHYEAAAKGKDKYAYYAIGKICFDGKGVQQDYTQAAQWFSQASKENVPYADYQLARMCDKGLGVD